MDKYYVYRPLLDLIGYTEGTDEGDGYNETLAYGKMLDGKKTRGSGPDVILTTMSLAEIDKLQTKMLADPDNARLNSSAIGRYQIVRTTMREIKRTLSLTGLEKFDADMQDRMACYLLGVRGIDKYLAGRLKEDTLINNLAKEWASLPTTKGKGHYDGQNARVGVARVRETLAEIKKRHALGQPTVTVEVPVEVPVEVEKPVVPKTIEREVNQKTNWFTTIFTTVFGAGFGGSWLAGMDRDGLILIFGIGVVVTLAVLVGGKWMVQRIKAIKAELEA
jgi:muramidase (phage lysozyme)